MKPMSHAVAAVAGAVPVGLCTGSAACALAFAAVMVFVDLDHLPDHFCWSTRRATLANFFDRGNCRNWSRFVFFLHSHEFWFLAALAGVLTGSGVLCAAALGWAAHLLMDEIGNRSPHANTRIHPLFYFFWFRMANAFRAERLCWPRDADTAACRVHGGMI
ncbi:MAG: hypothetical protein VB033_05865 [Solidesulfovibrio sp.]|nr:hypothetical protein [Solidesulfovibrio sp.]